MPMRQLLCQYDQGPPVTLLAPPKHLETTTISSVELEDVLQAHLHPVEPAVDIQLRLDPHLVDARRPSVPVESILGFWEEQEQLLGNVELQVTLLFLEQHQPTHTEEKKADTTAAASACCCNCEAPHSMWQRRGPLIITKPSPTTTKTTTSPQQQQEVKWVDARRASEENLSLTTPAACCHFLRSLLGTSHGSSPWAQNNNNCTEEEEEEKFSSSSSSSLLPGVVALVLPRETKASSRTLVEFRTGDACPSYFLHSVSQLKIPEAAATWWMCPQQEQTQQHAEDAMTTSDATLLVYRTIPPRDNLFPKHPLAIEERLPDGCLWERYRKHKNDHDDDVKDHPPDDEEEEEEDFFRPIGPPYVSYKQDYPNLLEPLLDHLDTLRGEALSIPQWTAWPERQHYRSSSENGDSDVASWTVFPLCHCFPAYKAENRQWIDVTCAHVPKTIELLRDTLGDTLRTALFSRLDPETTLEAHTGWQDLANHVLRVHIPLVVPPGGLCGTWVDGCVETHEEGRPLCFDDAKVHRAFNYSKQERIVLILDLARPSYLPVGTATGGHTEELDDFIAQLT